MYAQVNVVHNVAERCTFIVLLSLQLSQQVALAHVTRSKMNSQVQLKIVDILAVIFLFNFFIFEVLNSWGVHGIGFQFVLPSVTINMGLPLKATFCIIPNLERCQQLNSVCGFVCQKNGSELEQIVDFCICNKKYMGLEV